jgi:ATP-dependent DNA helicase RecG
MAALRDGETVQVEGVVRDCRVETRAAAASWWCAWPTTAGELVLRFLNFYPSQQKALARGPARARARRGARRLLRPRDGAPEFKAVTGDTPLPQALTPVYPTSAAAAAGLPAQGRGLALARAPLHELLPPAVLPPGLPTLREALHFLHHPPPDAPLATLEDHSHPAWQRLKFEELLAQQLSQLQASASAAPARPAGASPAACRSAAAGGVLPFAADGRAARVVAEIAADLARPQPMHRLLQGDVGSGKTVVAALAAAVAIDAAGSAR